MSELVEEISASDKLAVLLSMLPAMIIILVEVSSNIIIPTTFSDDWISLLGYFLQTMRHDD
jgi:hypothetical protein